MCMCIDNNMALVSTWMILVLHVQIAYTPIYQLLDIHTLSIISIFYISTSLVVRDGISIDAAQCMQRPNQKLRVVSLPIPQPQTRPAQS
jgi:hypothetical protein